MLLGLGSVQLLAAAKYLAEVTWGRKGWFRHLVQELSSSRQGRRVNHTPSCITETCSMTCSHLSGTRSRRSEHKLSKGTTSKDWSSGTHAFQSGLTASRNSATIWEPTMQIHEPWGRGAPQNQAIAHNEHYWERTYVICLFKTLVLLWKWFINE